MVNENPTENPAVVPENYRAALAALMSRIEAQDPVTAAKLRNVEDKSAVLTGLRDLKTMMESGSITGVTPAEVNAIHDNIEAAPIMSTRPVEEAAQKGLDAFRTLDPRVKTAAIVVGAGGTGILGFKFLGWAGKLAVQTLDGALDLGEKALKNAGGFFKWLLKTGATAAVGALAFMGIQNAWQKNQAAKQTPPTV